MLPTEKGFFSRVFLVPESSGEWGLVLDLALLNTFLAPVTFTMDTKGRVKRHLHPGMWATSIDLSDAYYYIQIRNEHSIYLCFQLGHSFNLGGLRTLRLSKFSSRTCNGSAS